ncbi:MAG TPA: hypothetical protein VJA23_04460 [Candidatus Nanoarchaeia archaeon]|nr:hypothetical protein [Candidatus Nanoarchaeia archaeon]
MSQIEQEFRQFLSKNPELETCYQDGLINRRSLARYLIKQDIAKSNQLEAVIAMLRRFKFKEQKQTKDLFSKIKINIKDKIIILDFQKEKELIQKLHHLIESTNYDRGDTLKIVVGSCSVKVFLDEENEKKVKNIVVRFKLQNRLTNLSEISVMFPENAIKERGVLSTITKELSVNDIVISELLTASPELLIYLKEEFVLKAYDILKRLQKN